jgi:hypothetical protein
MIGDEGVVVQPLVIISTGDGNFPPVDRKRVFSTALGHPVDEAILMDFSIAPVPMPQAYLLNPPTFRQKFDLFVERHMRIWHADHDEVEAWFEKQLTKRLTGVQIIPQQIVLTPAGCPALRLTQRLMAARSQSCFSCPSCGLMNSGSKTSTQLSSALTTTGRMAECMYRVSPLANYRREQLAQCSLDDEIVCVP